MIKKIFFTIYFGASFLMVNAQQPSNQLAKIELIKKTIWQYLKDDLKNIDPENRKFIFKEVDLNDDGKNEIFVGFINRYFCGSGGCTALLLANDGKIINHFTVSDFPFNGLTEKTAGWKNLVVRSNRADRLLKYNGTKYPSNPSVVTIFKGKINPKTVVKVLGYDRTEYPFFDF